MKLKSVFYPTYFPLLIWVFLGRLFVLLPYTWQLFIGRWLGRSTRTLIKRRRCIIEANLALCFPEKSLQERHRLMIKTFESMGMAAVEMMMAWWMSPRRFRKIPVTFYGYEHYEAAKTTGKGVIVGCAHFTCLEIIGRAFGQRTHYALVYQKNNNPFYQYLMRKGRKQYNAKGIPRMEMRDMVKWLRSGGTLFYAPDQDFGAHRSVFAPFFNIQTATLKATGWLAQTGNALFVPVMYNRTPDHNAYECYILPALENFPSGDDLQDASRFNQIIEAHVKKFPDQYLWAHRRFKTRPEGEPSIYEC